MGKHHTSNLEGGSYSIMQFTENAKMTTFGDINGVPTIGFIFKDGSKQTWNWNFRKGRWDEENE